MNAYDYVYGSSINAYEYLMNKIHWSIGLWPPVKKSVIRILSKCKSSFMFPHLSAVCRLLNRNERSVSDFVARHKLLFVNRDRPATVQFQRLWLQTGRTTPMAVCCWLAYSSLPETQQAELMGAEARDVCLPFSCPSTHILLLQNISLCCCSYLSTVFCVCVCLLSLLFFKFIFLFCRSISTSGWRLAEQQGRGSQLITVDEKLVWTLAVVVFFYCLVLDCTGSQFLFAFVIL